VTAIRQKKDVTGKRKMHHDENKTLAIRNKGKHHQNPNLDASESYIHDKRTSREQPK